MRLYTIQPRLVYDTFKEEGVFHSRPLSGPSSTLSAFSDDFKFSLAYEWMVQQMSHRGLERPSAEVFPIWGYYQWAGRNRPKPDLRYGYIKAWANEERHVLMTLEIPPEEVLLSDHSLWIGCLNYLHIGTVKESDAFYRRLRKGGVALGMEIHPSPEHEEVLDSWGIIFDLDRSRKLCRRRIDDQEIQATFWALKMEHVVGAVEFGMGAPVKVLPRLTKK